ncbi:nicotinamide-nucleotide adenylyltransferase [Candidatus Bathyarchaeota archaeon ex4484_205]|nr:MAG: nicotinamide-nucleotide adenylyltransferase [Candidatus Bathyarchaeota archaeon ex4484_205]RLG69144.1 MAG: nicotinamide-nucleotide adenylyltransferase [archaeon]
MKKTGDDILKKVGLYVGRFQPFHLGHLFAVKYALKRVDELIIVIGSSQKSHEPRHPFTTGERITMIVRSLEEEKIPRSSYLIVPVPDTEVHPTWVSLVEFMCPKFNIVFSNDPLTIRLMEESGYKVIQVPLKNREFLSGTEIRRRILKDLDWQSYVPAAVRDFIMEIDGCERIKVISKNND